MRSRKTTAELIYCKTRTYYAYKLRVQDFATDKNVSFNQCSKLFLGKVILKKQ